MSEPRAKHAFIGAGAGCAVLLLVGGITGVLAVVAALLLGKGDVGDPAGLERYAMYGLPFQHLALLSVTLWLASRFGGAAELLAWKPARRWWLVLLVFPVGFVSDFVVHTAYEIAPWLDLGGLDLLDDALLGSGPLGMVLTGLGAIVLAPIAEEVLFRGYVFRGVSNSWGTVAAVAVSTLLFAVFHADPLHALGVVVIGVWLGWLRHVTGSIKTCIAAHLLNNAFWVVESFAFETVPDSPWWIALIAAGGTIGVGVLVSRRAPGLG
ncbi:MAG TPA: CPBP family intramembrane glutamic endopeptidase [Myxococcota bacterium]|nr:CPBP family intramembrane glutamic endopeptidase [Myxococcota bacterium]